ncbi:MAG: hypothetical protein J6A89_04030 [Clostridia bacterium]|nr:hypothetical protein [Clostridia bacterium]
MEDIQCNCCDSDYESEYYKYNNEIYCFDCLTEKLKDEGKLNVVTTTKYYTDDWGYLGDNEELADTIQEICEYYDVEEIRN